MICFIVDFLFRPIISAATDHNKISLWSGVRHVWRRRTAARDPLPRRSPPNFVVGPPDRSVYAAAPMYKTHKTHNIKIYISGTKRNWEMSLSIHPVYYRRRRRRTSILWAVRCKTLYRVAARTPAGRRQRAFQMRAMHNNIVTYARRPVGRES